MPCSALPSVLGWPEDSRPGREIAADLRMHEEQRVKASLEYRETVGNEIASSILESTDMDDDAAIVVDISTQTKTIEIKSTNDFHLFKTLIFSLALTRSNLIGFTLKLLQKTKGVDLKYLPLDEKRNSMNAFHND